MSNRGSKKRKVIRIWRWRWWSHHIRSSCEGIVTPGLYSYLKNCLMMPKSGCPTRIQNCFQGQLKGFFSDYKIQISKINCKLNLFYQEKAHKRPNFKKSDAKQPFPPPCTAGPAETDPYMEVKWKQIGCIKKANLLFVALDRWQWNGMEAKQVHPENTIDASSYGGGRKHLN